MKHIEGENRGHIVLYALSTCVWCRKTQRLLDSLGVEYYHEAVDLLEPEEKTKVKDVIRKWDPTVSFPVLVIDDKKCVLGFDEDKIKGYLVPKQ